MCNKKEKRVILLNNPIESTESDLFGINIYVDSIEQAIDSGAKIIGVTSTFGGGKSSIIKNLKNKYKWWELRYKFINVSMWNQIESSNINNLRTSFLYNLSQKRGNKNSYIAKYLSKNFGVIDISIDLPFILKLLISILGGMSYLLIKNNNLVKSVFLQYFKVGNDIYETVSLLILAIFVFTVILLVINCVNIVFSSPKSESVRDLDEVDYYRVFNEIINKNGLLKKNLIVAIEDLDRTTDYKSLIQFLMEIKKFSDSYHGKHNLVFIITIKSEIELLEGFVKQEKKNESKNNRNLPDESINIDYKHDLGISYEKLFDYIVDVPKINIVDYSIVLNDLIDSDSNIKAFCDNEKMDIAKMKIELFWLAKGDNLSIRKVKERINRTFQLYYSIKESHSQQTISLQKCAISVYLQTQYTNVFYCLKDDGLDDLISDHIVGKTIDVSLLKKAIDLDLSKLLNISDIELTYFSDELNDMIQNQLIDLSYRFYSNNTPKNAEFLNIDESVVYNTIIFNKKIGNYEEQKFDTVNVNVTIKAIDKYLDYGKGLPNNIYDSDFLFKICVNTFRKDLVASLREKTKDESFCLTDNQVSCCFSCFNEIISDLPLKNNSKFVTTARMSLIKNHKDSWPQYNSLFIGGDLFINDKEIVETKDLQLLLNVINLKSQLYNLNKFKFINNKIKLLVDDTASDNIIKLIDNFYINSFRTFEDYSVLNSYCEILEIIKKEPKCLNDYLSNNIDDLDKFNDAYSKVMFACEKDITNSSIQVIMFSNTLLKLPFSTIQELYEHNCYLFIKEMLYNGYENELVFDDDNILISIENNNAKFTKDEIIVLRKTIVSKQIKWNYLFMNGNPLTKEEMKYSKSIEYLLYLSDKNLFFNVIYEDFIDYIKGFEISRNELKIIYDYIFSLPVKENIVEIINKIDCNIVPFNQFTKTERNRYFVMINEEVSDDETRLSIMSNLKILSVNYEKEFSAVSLKNTEFEKTYTELINSVISSDITKTTTNNIKKFGHYALFDESVENIIFKRKIYNMYLYSRIKRLGKFDFETHKDDYEFNSKCFNMYIKNESLKSIKPVMIENDGFLDFIVKNNLYKELSEEDLLKLRKCLQTYELCLYVFEMFDEENQLSYFSEIEGFENKKTMMFVVNKLIQSKLVSNKKLYKKLYEVAIDKEYRTKLTRSYNKFNGH